MKTTVLVEIVVEYELDSEKMLGYVSPEWHQIQKLLKAKLELEKTSATEFDSFVDSNLTEK